MALFASQIFLKFYLKFPNLSKVSVIFSLNMLNTFAKFTIYFSNIF